MKKKMRYQVIAGVIALGLLCIAADSTNKPLFRSQADRIEELEKQNLELKKQVEELNRKLDILSSRVNECTGGSNGASFSQGDIPRGQSPDVPSGLATVRIKPNSSNNPTITAPGGSVTVNGQLPPRKGVLTRMSTDAIVPVEGPIPPTNYQPPTDPANPSGPPPVLSYSSSGSAPAAAPDGPALAAGEAAAYKQIKDMLNADQTDLAAPLMEQYLKRHPRGAHEDEIAYRLGEYYYSRGEYRKAVEPLKKVRQSHYTSNVAPDAIYTLGLCYAELGQLKEAQDALEEVESIYPFSDAAPKATKKLESIR